VKLAPKIDCIAQSEIKFSKYDAIAIPIAKGETTLEVTNPKFVKQVEKHFGLNLSDLLSKWPDATGKAGELIEVPAEAKGSALSRIYFVGIGSDSPEDLRKAAAALSRKVKNSGSIVLDSLVATKQNARPHLVALVLASYSWTQKSVPTKELKASSFDLVGNFERELTSAKALATGVWRARDLIHTP